MAETVTVDEALQSVLDLADTAQPEELRPSFQYALKKFMSQASEHDKHYAMGNCSFKVGSFIFSWELASYPLNISMIK